MKLKPRVNGKFLDPEPIRNQRRLDYKKARNNNPEFRAKNRRYLSKRRERSKRLGLCQLCHKDPAEENLTICKKCSDQQREGKRIEYHRKRAETQEAREAAKKERREASRQRRKERKRAYNRTPKAKKQMRLSWKRTAEQRKLQGLCPKCGNPPEDGYITCKKCLLKAGEYGHKRQRTQEYKDHRKNRYVNRKEKSQCINCPEKARPGRTKCELCLEKDRERAREKCARQKKEEIERGIRKPTQKLLNLNNQERKDLGICMHCDESTTEGTIPLQKTPRYAEGQNKALQRQEEGRDQGGKGRVGEPMQREEAGQTPDLLHTKRAAPQQQGRPFTFTENRPKLTARLFHSSRQSKTSLDCFYHHRSIIVTLSSSLRGLANGRIREQTDRPREIRRSRDKEGT